MSVRINEEKPLLMNKELKQASVWNKRLVQGAKFKINAGGV